jgi:hypothetical protein
MAKDARSNPFGAFLPASRKGASGILPPNTYFLQRAESGDSCALAIDGLDAFLISCAENEVSLEELCARLPCSRSAALERMERLVGLGLLEVRRVSTAPVVSQSPGIGAELSEEHETLRPRASHGP